ncbi:MAG: CopL family metal-binding regulatory protein [Pseudomarimonas sp.]
MAHAVGTNADGTTEVADAGHQHAHEDSASSAPAEHQHDSGTDSSGDCCNSAACTCGCMSGSTGALAAVVLMPHAAASAPGLATLPEVAPVQTSAPFRPPTV